MATEDPLSGSELREEIEYFQKHLDEWMETHRGKWVVVKNQEVLGFYDTFKTADKQGMEAYGAEPFLVRQVKRDHSFSAPAYAHGLLGS